MKTNRYSRANIKLGTFKRSKFRDREVKSLTTTIYEKVPLRDDDIYVISQHGDRLDKLASEFYGNPTLWWFIARVNHLKSMNLKAGISLRIPVSTDKADTI